MTIQTPSDTKLGTADSGAVVEAALARAKAARTAGITLDPPFSAIEVDALLAALVGIGQLTAAEAHSLKVALTHAGGMTELLTVDAGSMTPLYAALRNRAQVIAVSDSVIDDVIAIGEAIVQVLEVAGQIVDGISSLWDAIFG